MNYEYLNSKLSPMERTMILLSQMTIEEKVGQMVQVSASKTDVIKKEDGYEYINGELNDEEVKDWTLKRHAGSFLHVIGDRAKYIQELAASTRLAIPVIFGIDAIHGHALHNGATIFPSQLAMSCSWNEELIEKMGRVTAKEVTADGLNWTFSPVLCIGRDLRWGRINETLGEDPYLIGELGAAMIKGYQGKNIADDDSILACAKHYIAYGESTGGRDSYDTQISYRKLREVFLPPFKRAVDVGCCTFMAGYQSIDGNPASSNSKILREILKKELGFDGFVVTDWDNTGNLMSKQKIVNNMNEASGKVIEAGNDMIMNTPEFYKATLQLVENGKISEALIDDAVKRILYIKFTMGLFEKVKKNDLHMGESVFSCKEHLDVNLNLARECPVLLENKNNTLPLARTVKKIAVIGPNADDIRAQYGDWTFFSHPTPKDNVIAERPYYTILEGIKEIAQKRGVEVVYHKGCHIMDKLDEDIKGAIKEVADVDVIVAVIGDCLDQNGEFKDRADLNLSGAQQRLLEELKGTGKPLIVVLVNGKPLSVPWVAENADALIETFNSGMFGGKATSEIIFGETNPSGKLTISFPYHSGQLPVYYNQLLGWHGEKYMDMPMGPLYSFGYGLSYSSFEYSNLELSHKVCKIEDIVTIKVDVTNTSKRDGTEIVQLYVNDVISSIITPFKQLKGFKRTLIKSGETKTVSFELGVSELYIVDQNENYIVEPGEFTIMVGTDSRDVSLLKDSFTVTA